VQLLRVIVIVSVADSADCPSKVVATFAGALVKASDPEQVPEIANVLDHPFAVRVW
jgi:hypothetical protein